MCGNIDIHLLDVSGPHGPHDDQHRDLLQQLGQLLAQLMRKLRQCRRSLRWMLFWLVASHIASASAPAMGAHLCALVSTPMSMCVSAAACKLSARNSKADAAVAAAGHQCVKKPKHGILHSGWITLDTSSWAVTACMYPQRQLEATCGLLLLFGS